MVLESSKAVELMAKERPELHRTIREWLIDFIADIKAAFTGIEAKHTESKAMTKYMDELARLWDLGLPEVE